MSLLLSFVTYKGKYYDVFLPKWVKLKLLIMLDLI
nr:MAG TPA: hypothetical protein [Bacteriophage sp.]